MTDKIATHDGCSVCSRRDVLLKKDGTLRNHVHANLKGSSFLTPGGSRCDGSNKLPKAAEDLSDAERLEITFDAMLELRNAYDRLLKGVLEGTPSCWDGLWEPDDLAVAYVQHLERELLTPTPSHHHPDCNGTHS